MARLRDEPRFTFHELDLRVDDLDPVLAGADAVVNEEATPGLVLSWTDFDQYLSCDVTAVHRLIEACTERGTGRFVHASTSSVYGVIADGDETSPTRPILPYGVTELAAENLLLAHHLTSGFPVVVLRYFSIYGPRQRPDWPTASSASSSSPASRSPSSAAARAAPAGSVGCGRASTLTCGCNLKNWAPRADRPLWPPRS